MFYENCNRDMSFICVLIPQVINSKKNGVFSPACFMHSFSGENSTHMAKTLSYEIEGERPEPALYSRAIDSLRRLNNANWREEFINPLSLYGDRMLACVARCVASASEGPNDVLFANSSSQVSAKQM